MTIHPTDSNDTNGHVDDVIGHNHLQVSAVGWNLERNDDGNRVGTAPERGNSSSLQTRATTINGSEDSGATDADGAVEAAERSQCNEEWSQQQEIDRVNDLHQAIQATTLEAVAVQEAALVVGAEHEDSGDDAGRIKNLIRLGLGILIVAGIASAISLGVSSRDRGNSLGDGDAIPSSEPTFEPTIDFASIPSASPTVIIIPPTSASRLSNLQDLFCQIYKDCSVLMDTAAVEYQALNWLAHEDPQQLPLDNFTRDTFGNHESNEYQRHYLVQRYALATLYFATDGQDWNNQINWLSETSHCSWHGIECTNMNANFPNMLPAEVVTGLVLEYSGLSNEIPAEIGMLTTLNVLNVRGNAITDIVFREIPTLWPLYFELARLLSQNLEVLDLSENSLDGTLPVLAAALTNLKDLHVSHNALSGSLPSEGAALSKLEIFDLSHNSFSGSIPTEFSRLQLLQHLALQNQENQLTGTLPSQLGQLSALTKLELQNNALTGTIPTEYGNLDQLQLLSVSNNQLSGTVPSELGMLVNLLMLDLEQNNLMGTIPIEYTQLTCLVNASLASNNFTGNLNDVFCTTIDGIDKWKTLHADCIDKVSCSCCTHCL